MSFLTPSDKQARDQTLAARRADEAQQRTANLQYSEQVARALLPEITQRLRDGYRKGDPSLIITYTLQEITERFGQPPTLPASFGCRTLLRHVITDKLKEMGLEKCGIHESSRDRSEEIDLCVWLQ